MSARRDIQCWLKISGCSPARPPALLSVLCFRKAFVFGLAQLKLFFLPSVWGNFSHFFNKKIAHGPKEPWKCLVSRKACRRGQGQPCGSTLHRKHSLLLFPVTPALGVWPRNSWQVFCGMLGDTYWGGTLQRMPCRYPTGWCGTGGLQLDSLFLPADVDHSSAFCFHLPQFP